MRVNGFPPYFVASLISVQVSIMASLASSALCARSVFLNRLIPASFCGSVRLKHYNPQFKWHRGKKVRL
jgi:hypothetical protein